jgi:hypothetical protein
VNTLNWLERECGSSHVGTEEVARTTIYMCLAYVSIGFDHAMISVMSELFDRKLENYEHLCVNDMNNVAIIF